jgi:hypothetical protein
MTDKKSKYNCGSKNNYRGKYKSRSFAALRMTRAGERVSTSMQCGKARA